MHPIDFVCEDDVSPRVTLLIEYLDGLGVPVQLRRSLPDRPSEPVVLLPSTSGSAWTSGRASKLWSVAIYLDLKAGLIPATHQFAIEAWPARSCDPLLAQLANYLKRPGQVAFPDTGLPTTAAAAIDPARRQERRVLAGFGVAACIFVLWMFYSQADGENDQTATEQYEHASAHIQLHGDQAAQPEPISKPAEGRETVLTGADSTSAGLPSQQSGAIEELAAEFDRQHLAHPDQCLLTQTPPPPLQATTANTRTTRPAGS